MSGIRVTIGVPTVGDNPFVWTALASALDNLAADRELVISDNASPMGRQLAAFARNDARIVTIRQASRLTMADNWNQCLAKARGDYFLLLSDDDVLLPGMVDALCKALDESPENGVAYGRFEWIDEAGRVFWTSPRAPRLESSRDTVAGVFARKRVVLPSATMMRRTDLLDVGGYDAAFGNWADMAAWMRIGARYRRVAFHETVSIQYRERRTSLTKTVDDAAWTRGIERTRSLLDELYPADAPLKAAGLAYQHYMLADIRLKRLLAEPSSMLPFIVRTWAAGDRLPARHRAWLTMKGLYLRNFAKLDARR